MGGGKRVYGGGGGGQAKWICWRSLARRVVVSNSLQIDSTSLPTSQVPIFPSLVTTYHYLLLLTTYSIYLDGAIADFGPTV